MNDQLQDFLIENEIPYSDFVHKIDIDYKLGLITFVEAIDEILDNLK